MPYIDQNRRDALNPIIDDLFNRISILNWIEEKDNLFDKIKGELNYIIFILVKKLLNKYGMNYSRCQDLIGTLDCAKEEIRRRILNPYEELKIKENGDCL